MLVSVSAVTCPAEALKVTGGTDYNVSRTGGRTDGSSGQVRPARVRSALSFNRLTAKEEMPDAVEAK